MGGASEPITLLHRGQFVGRNSTAAAIFVIQAKAIGQGYVPGLHAIGDFSIYISSGTGTWGPPIRTGSRSEIVAIRLQ